MEEEFDLLAGHDLGESNALPQNDVDPEMVNILVWHKLETKGFQPPAREGHSAVTSGMSVYVFGGFQAGKRTNSVLSLNVITGSWSVVNCTGSIPSIRSFHAACSVDNFMFIHGGESQIDGTIENNTVPTASRHSEDLQQAVLSSSGADIKQSVKTPSIVESSVWNSTVDEEPESVAMDGVCPGDTIGFQRNLPTIVQGNDVTSNPIDKIPRMCCVDDFYVLDTISREWHKISCILSPLPRKGHSMVIANIDNKPHVVIFGGYSSDNLTLSNSIHVCEVSKVLQHYKNCQTSANSSAINKIKALRQQETSNKPVVFRTLNCKGTPPTPRYRHSCTIVSGGINEGGSQEQFMVVVGGIGKDPNAALCDVHVLNLNTLQWLNVPSDALEKGHAGEGPSTGIYGHTAFAVPNVAATSGLPVVAAGAIDNAIPVELMVYGGSSNATSGKSNCHRHIYGLDLMTYQWRRIRTGFAFPSARNNHSAAVISGWAPSNTMPSSGGLSSSMGGSASAVVVFGGVNSIMCASDTWALDLKWRPPGVDAYDGNINERVDEGVAYQVTQKPVTPIEQHFLKASGVGPLSGTTTTENLINAKTNRSSIQASNDEKYFSLMKPSSSTGALLSSSAKGGTAKLPPSGKNRTQAGNRNQYQDESEGEEAEEEQVVQVLKVSASDPNFQQSLRRLKQSNNNSSAMNASRSYDFLGTASEQLNRELLQSTMMLATSETAGTEDQQVGHAFLKIRKERAQADILLKQETSRATQAETANAQLRAEFDTFQASAAAEKEKLQAEIAELKVQLERSFEREKQLQILNEEAYNLLILGGIKQL